jgi:molybdenum cofactor biosynthesis enzyme MoaA
MMATRQWSAGQFIGRWWPIGCVALEITQRCNLDCTACYLSEYSEVVKDLPLEEVYRRIDAIFNWYGPNTNVQVTGGEPTLRKREELIAIVRRIADRGMRPALITNGIRAKRALLQELTEVGLVDVAFHVDLTQQRRGYDTEQALNVVRREYIERSRGLSLSVLFNTTVCDFNLHDMQRMVELFVKNSDVVRLASFQLQADTGRSVLGRRDNSLTLEVMQRQIEAGAGTSVSFDAIRIGHQHCSRYGMVFITNGRAYDALDDANLVQLILQRMPRLRFDRRSRSRVIRSFAKGMLASPALWPRATRWVARKAWQARSELMAARGRVNKLSFLVHNFMDACQLDNERVDACTFMAATAKGPVSMCLHNATRDAFILQPIRLSRPTGDRFWQPLSGVESTRPMRPPSVTIIHRKGGHRARVPRQSTSDRRCGCPVD